MAAAIGGGLFESVVLLRSVGSAKDPQQNKCAQMIGSPAGAEWNLVLSLAKRSSARQVIDLSAPAGHNCGS